MMRLRLAARKRARERQRKKASSREATDEKSTKGAAVISSRGEVDEMGTTRYLRTTTRSISFRKGNFKYAKIFQKSSLLICCLCLLLICTQLQQEAKLQTPRGGVAASSLSDYDGATFYKAPVGSRIRIACNASHWHDDSISLVLWFKGSSGGGGGGNGASSNVQPVYTIDARQKPLSSGQARHLVADSLKGRAKFVLPSAVSSSSSTNPANKSSSSSSSGSINSTGAGASQGVPYLDLAPLDADDQGEYRCRVDYRSRPRENFLIILFVLVPPSSLEIMDTNGRSLEQIYGPLNEGAQLTLLCLSKGGRPPPAILWKRDGRVIDDSYLTLNDFVTLKMATGAASGNGTSTGNELAARQLAQAQDGNLANSEAQLSAGSSSSSSSSSSKSSLLLTDWPEFNYFLSSAPLIGAGDEAERPPTGKRPTIPSGGGGGAPTQRQREQPESRAQLLIDWRADSAMETSVNVLHFGELTRAHLMPSSLTASAPASAAAATTTPTKTSSAPFATERKLSPRGRPQLECHASNMHYDLRALIKIFAPPSLFGQDQLQLQQQSVISNIVEEPSTLRNKMSKQTEETRAFAQAIERAVLANLKSLSTTASAESTQQQASARPDNELLLLLQPAARQTAAAAGATPTSAFESSSSARFAPAAHLPTSSADSAPAGDLSSAAAAAASPQVKQETEVALMGNMKSQAVDWQQLIYQQLVRPHQLVVQAASLSGTQEQQPLQASGKTANGSSGAAALQPLARSKLIALEANLRPLDVKITSPARPLIAGQVHEFTCRSSGSRPPARLSWLKNGLKLDAKLARQVDTVVSSSFSSSSSSSSAAAAANGSGAIKSVNPSAFASSSGDSARPQRKQDSGNGDDGDYDDKTVAASALPAISVSRLALRLERDDHNARLSCRAENANFQPGSTSGNSSSSISSIGTTNKLATTASDSTAAQSDTRAPPSTQEEEEGEEDEGVRMSTTIRSFTTGADAANQSSSSSADLGDWLLEDSVTLSVNYAPKARLELGNKMLSERIRENKDIFFVCHVDSQPPVSEITWLHNDKPINESTTSLSMKNRMMTDSHVSGAHNQQDTSSSSGADRVNRKEDGQLAATTAQRANLILSNNSLVLQRVQLEQSGQYSCLASNSEGVGLSNRLELRVLHAPLCVSLGFEHNQRVEHSSKSWQTNNASELYLGTYRLPPASGGLASPSSSSSSDTKPLRQPAPPTCQMLVPPGDDEHLELSWYLYVGGHGAGEQRRLLARSRKPDLRLIEVETMNLPALLAARADDDDNDDASLAAGAASYPRASSARPSSERLSGGGSGQKPLVALATLNLDAASLLWATRQTTATSAPDGGAGAGAGRLYCLARNSMGEQKRACVYSIERAAAPPENSGSSHTRKKSSRVGAQSDNNSEQEATDELETTQEAEEDDMEGGAEELANGQAATLACLPVNVTTSSVWIGCNSNAWLGGQQRRRQQRQQQSRNQQGAEISQVEENNDQLRAARFRFNVLVYSLASKDDEIYDAPRNNSLEEADKPQQQPPQQQQHKRQLLDANLTSQALNEPLFAVVNLKAATNYLLDISDLSESYDERDGATLQETREQSPSSSFAAATVRLRTKAAASSGSVEESPGKLLAIEAGGTAATARHASTGEIAPPRPSIRQVTEPHPSDLVAAALISTRSTPSGPSQHGNNYHLQQQQQQQQVVAANQQQQRRQQQPSSMWLSLSSALGRLLGSQGGGGSEGTRRAYPLGGGTARIGATSATVTPPPPPLVRWINFASPDGLLALCVCLAVLLLTLVALIALHRSWFACAVGADDNQDQDRNQCARNGGGGGGNGDAKKQRHEPLLTRKSGADNNGANKRPSVQAGQKSDQARRSPPPPADVCAANCASQMSSESSAHCNLKLELDDDEHETRETSFALAAVAGSNQRLAASPMLHLSSSSIVNAQQQQQNRYSSLQRISLQAPTTRLGAQTYSSNNNNNADGSKPSINFLRTSSISSSASLQRRSTAAAAAASVAQSICRASLIAAQPLSEAMICAQQEELRSSSVTRSRSTNNFHGSVQFSAGAPPTQLLLPTRNDAELELHTMASAQVGGPRLMELPANKNNGGGGGGGEQRYLISDANLVASATPASRPGERHNNAHNIEQCAGPPLCLDVAFAQDCIYANGGGGGPRSNCSSSNCRSLSSFNSNSAQTTATTMSPGLPPQLHLDGAGEGGSLFCNCHELSGAHGGGGGGGGGGDNNDSAHLTLIGDNEASASPNATLFSASPDCPHHKHDFSELLTAAQNNHHNHLLYGQIASVEPILPIVPDIMRQNRKQVKRNGQQQQHQHQHHVVFDQASLQSSASPSPLTTTGAAIKEHAGALFGSPQLSSLTTNDTMTLSTNQGDNSYHQNQQRAVLHNEGGISVTLGRSVTGKHLNSGASTSNYSSDGSSSIGAIVNSSATGRAQNGQQSDKRAPKQVRLTSILKQCEHAGAPNSDFNNNNNNIYNQEAASAVCQCDVMKID